MNSCVKGWTIKAVKGGGARCKQNEKKPTNILHEPIPSPFKK